MPNMNPRMKPLKKTSRTRMETPRTRSAESGEGRGRPRG